MEVICVGIFMVGLGLVSLFAPDMMWELTAFGNSWEGKKSERSELWEINRVIGGVVALLIGLAAIVLPIIQSNQDRQDDINSTATATALQADLRDTFASDLAAWQSDATNTITHKRVSHLNADVYYGICEDAFYAYVKGYPGEYDTYAYFASTRIEPGDCLPATFNVTYVSSLGDGWYNLGWFFPPASTEMPRFTATPTPAATRTPRPD
jgi:hypothetical protein